MSSTPRAKPTAKPEAASPRASAKPAAAGDKKPKAKKPKASSAPTAPMTMDKPVVQAKDLSEEVAKSELDELQQKYGALIVSFNNQQAELQQVQKVCADLEAQNAAHTNTLKMQASGNGGEEAIKTLTEQLEKATADLRASEAANMSLQKKVNKLQVEHVSEEEVDQLFYALEVKEQQLEQVTAEKEGLEAEVLTARQLSARGQAVPTIVEIHHHNDLSDDEDADGGDAPSAAADAPAKNIS